MPKHARKFSLQKIAEVCLSNLYVCTFIKNNIVWVNFENLPIISQNQSFSPRCPYMESLFTISISNLPEKWKFRYTVNTTYMTLNPRRCYFWSEVKILAHKKTLAFMPAYGGLIHQFCLKLHKRKKPYEYLCMWPN